MGKPGSFHFDRPDPNKPPVAGLRRFEMNAIEPGPHPTGDRPLPDRPERPCSRCGKTFQPTLKRRMLCVGCFARATGGDEAA